MEYHTIYMPSILWEKLEQESAEHNVNTAETIRKIIYNHYRLRPKYRSRKRHQKPPKQDPQHDMPGMRQDDTALEP